MNRAKRIVIGQVITTLLMVVSLVTIAFALTGCSNELGPLGTLQVHTNHPHATFSVSGEVDTEVKLDCELLEEGLYACEAMLPSGDYVLTGKSIHGYKTPLYVPFTISTDVVQEVDFFYEVN